MPNHFFSFLRNTSKNLHAIGAFFPSSQFVGRAMAEPIPPLPKTDYKVLEVGAGTGTITREITKKLEHAGTLDVYELLPDFCKILRQKIQFHPDFKKMAGRIHLHEGNVLDFQPTTKTFDLIISEVPLTNFSPEQVRHFFNHYQTLLKPGGELVWIEYFLLRNFQKPFITKERRGKLEAIEKVQQEFSKKHEFAQKVVFLNLPPALIHYLRF